ncbi:U3 small nucleolar ribonucleo MPP10 [Pelobates cultripes]|uniref:U3 small nucleolar ribonucleoprotein protein MPP10 n=1 Tax=Pelobates cultripes TaxID=61616 RepID=A0AAD1VW50_PELCU|nr:U3 small nucleolar ribonucleo MPP10 [Pelobates cultripes]
MANTVQSPPALGQCMEVLEAVSAHPEQLLSVQEELAGKFSQLTKVLYDLHKSELALGIGSPLKELVTENFDDEQIWQQIELQNSTVLNYFKNAVRQSVKDRELYLVEPSEEEASESEGETEEDVSELEPEVNIKRRDGKENSGKHLPKANFRDDDESDLDSDVDELEQQNKPKQNKKPERKQTNKKPTEKSIVDDQFFNLAEMEAYLDAAEKDDDANDDDESEEDVEYFEDIESGDEEDFFDTQKTKQKESKSSRDLYYKDYFDSLEGDQEDMEEQPSEEDDLEENEDNEEGALSDDANEQMSEYDEEEEEPMEETEESKKAKETFKRVTFAISDESEGEDIGDILGGKKQHDVSEPSEPKSSFEKREEKMTEKINALQNQMLAEKAWQLSGEVTAQKRPENSLLSETLQFDHAIRMAPIITEETTVQLEDIIKQRIKDQIWDDVVKKEKPKENPFEFKKRLTLDHDKSKLSLAEIYEQEYLKLNQKKTEEEENPKHVEIQKIMDSLFLKLDSLSNFHFTPKPAIPEIKVVSNVPAISMEEVAPVAASEAALVAPEEVKEKNKAGDIKTRAEKTSTDKNRDRRKKKLTKRLKIKEKEKRLQLVEKTRAESGKKPTKQAAEANLKKLAKEGKATILKDEGKDKALKSSQAFFSQLQDQVRVQIKGAKVAQKKTKKGNELSAHKLKL